MNMINLVFPQLASHTLESWHQTVSTFGLGFWVSKRTVTQQLGILLGSGWKAA